MKRILPLRLSQSYQAASALREAKDCTVRSLSVGLDMPYEVAHAVLGRLGRKNGHGFKLALNHKRFGAVWRADLKKGTVLTTLRGLPRGRFWVLVRHHIFAVVDGVQCERCPTVPLTRVKGVYQLPQVDTSRLLPASV